MSPLDRTTRRDVDVLVAHQRLNMRYCGCGWDGLGYSHAEHVAAMLADRRVGDGLVLVERDLLEDAADNGMDWKTTDRLRAALTSTATRGPWRDA